MEDVDIDGEDIKMYL